MTLLSASKSEPGKWCEISSRFWVHYDTSSSRSVPVGTMSPGTWSLGTLSLYLFNNF